ncbi:MAG: DUF2147 domain-containing protein [Halieaceae bacterium]
MLRIILGISLGLLAVAVQANSGAEGTWKTEVNDEGGYLEVVVGPCEADGSKLCGLISKAYSDEGLNPDYEHLGKLMVKNMEADGDNEFSGGTIWDPSADKVYKSKMQADGNELEVDGCVAFICSGQKWTRVQ